MQYTPEDISPVKKKINVIVPVEEVDSALSATIAMYRTSVSLDGFRKGKVPTSIVESRFRDSIYREATTDLVNVHINQIITELATTPVSRIDFDGGELERGKEFTYAISFEIMPAFTLPDFEKETVDQEEAAVDESEVDGVVERLRSSMAKVETVAASRTAQKGDIAVLDFEAVDADGKPVEGIAAKDFSLPLGEGQTLEDFENLVMTLKPGEKGEAKVKFPDDFFNAEFAGKTVTMKAELHELKERILPELNDEFAKKAGNFDSVEKLRDSIKESYMQSKSELHKSAAQKTLLDDLLSKVTFALPDVMVKNHIDILLGEMQETLERQGKNFESLGKSEEELEKEVTPEAENRARMQIFLLTTAKENGITVSEQEVESLMRRMAMQSRVDFNTVKEYYTKNNLLFALRDRLLCDKAMDFIYDKATVTMVPAGSLAKADAPKKTAEKKAATEKKSTKKAKEEK